MLFDLFGKKADLEPPEEGIEVYSGIRVEVTTFDERLLFVAKLLEPAGDSAQLQQYSENRVPLKGGSVRVRIRGYSGYKRKAVYMEGIITPELKNVWRAENLVITKVENERAFFRLNVNMDAVIIRYSGTEAAEKTCRLLNISIGGVYIFSEEKYAKGSRFQLRVKLLEESPESVLYCEVLRIIEKDEGAGYEYGCRFLDITEEEEQNITQNMFAIQSRRKDIC